jgi:hypothetical protein
MEKSGYPVLQRAESCYCGNTGDVLPKGHLCDRMLRIFIMIRGCANMKMKTVLSVLLLFSLLPALSAGDRAEWTGIGFCPDHAGFLSVQHGLDAEDLQYYVHLSCHSLTEGRTLQEYACSIAYPVHELAGMPFSQLLQNGLQRCLSRMDAADPAGLDQPEVLYERPAGEQPLSVLYVEDKRHQRTFSLRITQLPAVRVPGDSTNLIIAVTQRNADGSSFSYSLGRGDPPLENIYDVRLKQVFTDPDGRYLVLLFQTSGIDPETGTPDIRYLLRSTALEETD